MYQIVQRKMTQPPTSRTTSVKVSPVIFLEPSDVTIGLVDFKDKRTAGYFARYRSRNFTQNLRSTIPSHSEAKFWPPGCIELRANRMCSDAQATKHRLTKSRCIAQRS